MRKLRLALVLPITQFIVATILLHWGVRVEFYAPTPRLICWGLNAPALLFTSLDPGRWGPTFAWWPGSIIGVDMDDVFFLAGVIVVWYVVGRALDQRRTSVSAARRLGMVTTLIVQVLLLALGALLLVGGLWDLRHWQFGVVGQPPWRAVITLMWSAGLILLSGRGLVRAIFADRRRLTGGSTT